PNRPVASTGVSVASNRRSCAHEEVTKERVESSLLTHLALTRTWLYSGPQHTRHDPPAGVHINVATGRGQPTVPELAELLEDNPPVDRTSTNAWEDADFVAAVRATGRRKLIACALWTEICLAFQALDALREGYDVYPVVD